MTPGESFSCYYFCFIIEFRQCDSATATATAKSLQSCPTLCDTIDGSPPGSPVPGILQARILEWVAISFSNAWKWKMKVKLLSCVRLVVTPWTAAFQAPPPLGFSRQEYWSGVPLPSLSVTLGKDNLYTLLDSFTQWLGSPCTPPHHHTHTIDMSLIFAVTLQYSSFTRNFH